LSRYATKPEVGQAGSVSGRLKRAQEKLHKETIVPSSKRQITAIAAGQMPAAKRIAVRVAG
jgi:hypothetical protein